MSKAKSGGGPLMNKNVKVTPTGGSPNTRKVSVSGAAHIGRSVGNHAEGGKTLQRNDPPLYQPAKAATGMGNEIAKNVGRGGVGTGRINHGPSGSQGTHGNVNPGIPTPGGELFPGFKK